MINKPIIEKINQKINRSKVNYAVTLTKSIGSMDSTYINKIWELCGFRSKYEFERNFKRIHGISFREYVDNL